MRVLGMMEARERPKNARERAFGLGGVVGSVVTVVTCGLDWISRGQTVISIYPLLHYLRNPGVYIVELVATAFALHYATRLEKDREIDETPRIIRPFTEPAKPKRHRRWLKRSAWSMGTTLLILSIFFLLTHHHLQRLGGSANASSKSDPIPVASEAVVNRGKTQELNITSSPSSSKNLPPMRTIAKMTAADPPPSVESAIVQTNNQPLVTRPESVQAGVEVPIGCPPAGKVSTGWDMSLKPPSVDFDDAIPTGLGMESDRPVPIDRILWGHFEPQPLLLSPSQVKQAIALFDELRPRLPKPKTLTTTDGARTAIQVERYINRDFYKAGDFVVLSYSNEIPGGASLGGDSPQFRISSLSTGSRSLITDLDKLAKTHGDATCKNALHKLLGQAK